MPFSLESKPLGTIERYCIHSTDSELEILAGWGAGLNAWRIPFKGKTLDLLYGYRDAETFRKIQADTNAGVCLSPFPGRTAYARWNWNGKSYSLVNNVSWAPHALHGFLNVLPWKLVTFHSDDQSATLVLERDFYGDPAGYPFTYKVTNSYRFWGKSFEVKSLVENTGAETLPYAEGFHPYFMLGTKVDHLKLTLPECRRAILDSADIPTGKFEKESRFDGKQVGSAFINDYFEFETESSERESVLLENPDLDIQLDVWQKTGKNSWRGIQIYTPPDRESIALEPMTAEPDVLNHHRNLVEILPGKTAEFVWGAEIH